MATRGLLPQSSLWSLAVVAVTALMLARSVSLEEEPPVQYFQFVHSDSDTTEETVSSILDNATGVVMLGSHNYDICCYSQPVNGRNELQYDSSVFYEHITNYPHAQSVSSCIQTVLSRPLIRTAPRQKSRINGTVVCRSFSAGGQFNVTGWFHYDFSVYPQMRCNFSNMSAELSLGQELTVGCQFSAGWPPATFQCWIGADDIRGRDTIPLEAISSDSHDNGTTFEVVMNSWNRYYGRSLHCSAIQLCPVGRLCGKKILTNVQVSGQMNFKVRSSSSSCQFTELVASNLTAIRCSSTEGFPQVWHLCSLAAWGKETALTGNVTVEDSRLQVVTTHFTAPMAACQQAVAANASIREQGDPGYGRH